MKKIVLILLVSLFASLAFSAEILDGMTSNQMNCSIYKPTVSSMKSYTVLVIGEYIPVKYLKNISFNAWVRDGVAGHCTTSTYSSGVKKSEIYVKSQYPRFAYFLSTLTHEVFHHVQLTTAISFDKTDGPCRITKSQLKKAISAGRRLPIEAEAVAFEEFVRIGEDIKHLSYKTTSCYLSDLDNEDFIDLLDYFSLHLYNKIKMPSAVKDLMDGLLSGKYTLED